MQKHSDAMKRRADTVLEKNIPLTLLNGFERVTESFTVWEMSWWLNKDCNILTPTHMAITAFLSRSPGLLNRGPGGPASLEHGFHSSIFSPTPTAQSGVLRPPLLGASSLYSILSPTDSNFQCTELYYCFMPSQSLPITGQRNMQLLPSLECHVWSSSSGNNYHAVHWSPSSGALVCDWTVGF